MIVVRFQSQKLVLLRLLLLLSFTTWMTACSLETKIEDLVKSESKPIITVADLTLPENGGTGSLVVSINKPWSEDIIVPYQSIAASATDSSDYATASGNLTVIAGSTSASIPLTPVDDNLYEGSETMKVEFTAPLNASMSASSLAVFEKTVTITDNETQPEVNFAIASDSVAENVAGGSHTILLSLSGPTQAPVTVHYAVSNSGAVGAATASTSLGAGIDYSVAGGISGGTLTFASGATTASIVVGLNNDTISENSEPAQFTLSAPSAMATLGSVATHTLSITDDDGTPTLEFALANSSVAENVVGGSQGLNVNLSNPSSQTITVGYAVTGGTASGSGVDYTLNSGTLTFAPGQTVRTVSMSVVNDTVSELTETVVVSLSAPVNASLGAISAHTVSITDDDAAPVVNFAAATSNAPEGTASHSFLATLTGSSSQDITVNYSVTGGTASGSGVDFTLASGTLTFLAGTTTQTIAMTVVNDSIDESNETAIVTLASPTNATLGSTVTHTVSIVDDDSAPLVEFVSLVSSGMESVGSVTIDVRLSNPSASAVTVDYSESPATATGGGVDYTLAAGTLTFAAGETLKSFVFSVVDDNIFENTESIAMALANPVNATLGAQGARAYFINDNEATPTIQFSTATDSTLESIATKNIVVTMSGPSSQAATVNYAVTGGTATGSGSDFTLANGTLTFAAGETSKNISLTIVNDTVAEGDETVLVTLSNVTVGYNLGTSVHTHTIVDDEGPPTVQFAAAGSNANESVGSHTISVTLSSVASSDVTVDYQVTNLVPGPGVADGGGADYTLANGTLTFAAGQTTRNIVIPVVDDTLGEPNELVALGLSNVNGASATLGAQATHDFTINASDAPSIQYALATSAANESVGTHLVVVTLSNMASASVTVDYSVTGGTATGGAVDYTALTASTLNFAPGETSKTISLLVVDDTIYEGNETVTLDLTNASANSTLGAQVAHTFTINDNDGLPTVQYAAATSSASESASPHTFIVNLSGPLSVSSTVDYMVTGGTASGGGVDYTLANATLTFAAGVTTQTISLPVVNDLIFEGNETITLNISNPSVVTLGSQTTHTHTILDDETAPTFQYSAATSNASEALSPHLVTVTLSGPAQSAATVSYAVTGGTATGSGTDFTLASGTLTFAAGVTSQDISISIVNDAVFEGAETILMNLSAPTVGTLGSQITHTHTINDDDGPPTVQFASAISNAGEATTPHSIVVTLSGASGSQSTVHYSITASTATNLVDFSIPGGSGTLTFAAGITTQTISFSVVDDNIYEGDENFELTLDSPTVVTLGSQITHQHTINDNDTPPTVEYATATSSENEWQTVHMVGRLVNLQYESQFYSTNSYFYIDTATTNNTTTAPDGTLTAATFRDSDTAAAGVHQIGSGYVLADDQVYTLSTYVKPNTSTKVQMGLTLKTGGYATATFDLSGAGTTTIRAGDDVSSSIVARTIKQEKNGWYRISVSVNSRSGGAGNAGYLVTVDPISDSVFYDSNGANNSIYIWGRQLEIGSEMSTYSYNNTSLNVRNTGYATLSHPSAFPVTVNYSVTGGTATGLNTDYALPAGTLTFAPGETSKNILFSVTDDSVYEGNETIDLDMSGAVGASIGLQATHTHTIIDNDSVPTVQFASAASSAIESTASHLVVVNLSNPSSTDVTVGYSVSGGTATTTTDYTLPAGTLTFLSGETTKTISMTVVNDAIYEGNETVTMTLASPSGATLAAPTSHTHTITDDDTVPTISFASSTGTSNENIGTATIPVNLSNASSSTVTVQYSVTGGTATAGGVDFTLSAGTLTFAAGTTTANLLVPIVDDAISELTEDIQMTLASPVNGTLGPITVHTESIIDNEALPQIRFAAATDSTGESVASKTIPVTLSGASSQSVTVQYSVTGGTATGSGTDFTLASGTLTFAAGVTSQNITLNIVNDLLAEGSETVVVTLATPNAYATIGTPSVHTHTILDDESAPTLQFATSTSSAAETVGSQTIVVTMSGPDASTVRVDYAVTNTVPGPNEASNGSDYSLSSGTLTFASGETTKNIVVPVTNDTLGELDEKVVIQLSNLSVGTQTTLGTPLTHTFTILANDTPTVEYASATATVTEGGTNHQILVNLSAAASTDVTVQFAVTGGTAVGTGTDYSVLTASPLTITAGTTVGTIVVTTVDDTIYEGNETIIFNLTSPSASATLGSVVTHTTTINDNDSVPTVSFAFASAGSNESTAAQYANFNLSHASSTTILVPYTISGGTATGGGVDYNVAASGTFTFTPGQTSKGINFDVVNDTIYEGDETIIATLGAPTGATLGAITTFTNTITDNETAPTIQFSAATSNASESTASHVITITTSAPAQAAATVAYTVTGTATGGGVDYTLANGTFTMASLSTIGTITVPVINDAIYEGNETIILTLSSPTVATLGTTSIHTHTINDDETQPTVQFASGSSSDTEDVINGVFGSTTNEILYSQQISVFSPWYWWENSGGYLAANVASAPDSTMTASAITEKSSAGTTDHTFGTSSLNLQSSIVYTASAYVKPDTLSGFNLKVQNKAGAWGDASFDLSGNGSLMGAPTAPVSNATIQKLQNGWFRISMTFNSGSGATQPILMGGLYNSTNTTTWYDAGAGGKRIFTWGWQVELGTVATAYIPTTTTPMTRDSGVITLSGASALQTTVNYAAGVGTASTPADYLLASVTLTFAAGETAKNIYYAVTDDLVDESDETFVTTLSSPSNATLGGQTSHTHTIVDNDAAPILSILPATATVAESVGTHNIVVAMTNASSAAVTFNLTLGGTATGSGTDYTLATTHTIPALATSYTLPVVINDDTTSEPAETIITTLNTVTAGTATIHATNNTQTVTITDNDALPFTWLGTSGDGKWSTAANWSTNAVPGITETATFTTGCGVNCNVSVDVDVNVGGISILAGYTGTITNTTSTYFGVASNFSQAAGTFNVGATDTEIYGSMALSGGTFNANSAVIYFGGNFAVTGGGTFNAGTSYVSFEPINGTSVTHNYGTISFYNLEYGSETGYTGYTIAASGTITVNNDFTVMNYSGTSTSTITGGTFNLKKNVTVTSAYHKFSNSIFKINGSTAQSITGNSTVGLSNVEIANAAGGVSFLSDFTNIGNFTYTSGTVNYGTYQLIFMSPTGVTSSIDTGTQMTNAVTFRCTTNYENANFSIITNNMNVGTDLRFSRVAGTLPCNVNGNGIVVRRGLYSERTAGTSNWAGNTAITMSTNTYVGVINQCAGCTFTSGIINISKGTGSVSLATDVSFSGTGQDLNLMVGTINQNGFNLAVADVLSTAAGTVINKGCANLTFASHSPALGTINGGSANPNITISDNNQNERNSGTNDYIFVVSLSAPNCNSPVSVNFATANGMATAGSDYVANSGSLTFASGVTTATIPVTVNGDTTVEGHETFNVNLSSAVNGIITDSLGVGLIQNDDSSGFTWTGALGNNLWNAAGNWANGTVPSATSVVNFAPYACSGSNCNVTINTAASALGINVLSSFTGTITQSGANTLTTGTGGYTQQSSTASFLGGSGTITIGGPLSISSGSFRNTSGSIYIYGTTGTSTIVDIASGVTYNNNNGVTYLEGDGTSDSNYQVNYGVSRTFDHYILGSRNGTPAQKVRYQFDVPITVNNLTFANLTSNASIYLDNPANTVQVFGDIENTSGGDGGTGQIVWSGTTPKVYKTPAGVLPCIEVKGSSSLSAYNTNATISCLRLSTGSFVAPTGNLTLSSSHTLDLLAGSGSIFTHSSGTVILKSLVNSVLNIDMSSSISFNHLVVDQGVTGDTTWNFNGDTYNVAGNLSFTSTGGGSEQINSALFNLQGNYNGPAVSGTSGGNINFAGTGTQTVSGASVRVAGAKWYVQKPSGTLEFASNVSMPAANQDLDFNNGTINMNGYNLSISRNLATAAGTVINKGCSTITYATYSPALGTINGGSSSPVLFTNHYDSVVEGNSGTTTVPVVVNLDAPYCAGNFTVDYTTSAVTATAGVDYTSSSGTLTFAAGVTTLTVNFSVNGDTTPEDTEEFLVDFFNQTAGIDMGDDLIGITNDDLGGFTWDGSTGNNLWNDPANWSGNAVPSTTDDVYFMGTACTGANCNVTINTTVSVKSVNIFSSYTNTITQSGANTISTNSGGWNQSSGTFVGSSAGITIDGNFALNYGSFTATSGVLEVRGVTGSSTIISIASGATFVASTGQILVNGLGSGTATYQINLGVARTINNLRLGSRSGTGTDLVRYQFDYSPTVNVLTFDRMSGSASIFLDNNSVPVKVTGNIRALSGVQGGGGRIQFVGTSARTYESAVGTVLPKMEMLGTGSGALSAASSTVTMEGLILTSGNFTAPSTSLTFVSTGAGSVLTGNGALFIHNSADVIFASTRSAAGTFTLNMTSTISFFNLYVRNAGTFAHTYEFSSDTYVASNNLQFEKLSTGNLTINNGNFTLQGNLVSTSVTSIAGGSLMFNGVGTQTITQTGSLIPGLVWNINKVSGVVSALTPISLGTATQSLTLASGTVNLNSNNLSITGNLGTSAGTVINRGCATVTYATYSPALGTMTGSSSSPNVTIADVSQNEGASGTAAMPFVVTLSESVCAGNFTVNWATANNTTNATDLAAASGALTIAAGSTVGTITSILINGDATVEQDETFYVNLTSNSHGTITDAQAVGTILTDDFANFTWRGNSGVDLKWSRAANWQGGVVPTTQTAIFTGGAACAGANCNPLIDAAVTVGGINMQSTYSGTIAMNTYALDVGTGNFLQDGGTFHGGTAQNRFTGTWTMNAGTFTATSGIWRQDGSTVTMTNSALTFNHNNGTFQTGAYGGVFRSIAKHHIYNFDYNTYEDVQGTISVDGTLTTSDIAAFDSSTGGQIDLYGNLTYGHPSGLGSQYIRFVGSGNQTWTGNGQSFASIEVAKSSGTLSLVGVVAPVHWTYTSGNINFGTASFLFQAYNTWNRFGDLVYPNVTVRNYTGILDHWIIGGTLLMDDPTYSLIQGSELELRGNVNLIASIGGGPSTVKFTGGSNQTLTYGGAAADFWDGLIVVEKSGGTLYLAQNILLDYWGGQNMNFNAGAIDVGAYSLSINNNLASQPGTIFYQGCTGAVTFATHSPAGAIFIGGTTPGVSIADASIVEGNSGSTNMPFVVTLSSSVCAGNLTVNYATSDNTASAGADFTGTSGTLTFSGASTTATINVPISGDTSIEGSETFFMTLSAPVSATLTRAVATGQINNDDIGGNVWTGAAGTNLWSTPGNWADGSVPTAGQDAIFTGGACAGANCNVTIDSNINLSYFSMLEGFTGTITQAGSNTITTTYNFVRLDGSFIGGTGSISVGDVFEMRSDKSTTGQFIAGNQTITIGGNFGSAPGNFVAGLSTVVITDGTGDGIYGWNTVSPAITFNNLTLMGATRSIDLQGASYMVNGNLLLHDSDASLSYITNGTITVAGNVTSSNNGKATTAANPATIVMIGAGKTITGTSNSRFPSVTFNAPGNISMVGTLAFYGDLRSTGGLVDATGTSVSFNKNATTTVNIGNLELNDVTVNGASSFLDLEYSTLVVNGNLQWNAGAIGNGEIHVRGNLNVVSYTGGSLGDLVFDGSGNQSITQASGQNLPGATTYIIKNSGVVNLASNINTGTGQYFGISKGQLNMNGYNLSIVGQLSTSSGSKLFKGCGTLTFGTHNSASGQIYQGNDVAVSVANATNAEGNNVANVISVSPNNCVPTTVDYASVSGTAVVGSDLYATSGTATIPANTASTTISVPTMDDNSYEPAEYFTVVLSNLMPGTRAGTIVATDTISDNDLAPAVQFTSTSQTVGESVGSAVVTLTIGYPSAYDIVVQGSISGTAVNGTDYATLGTTFTLPAGYTIFSYSINITDDTTSESNETIILTGTSATNATIGAPASHTITITDNDQAADPTLSLTDSSSGSTLYTDSTAVNVVIANDSGAARWCLSETQTSKPANGTVPCVGGTGPSSGWYTVRPTTFSLSSGDGAKTVYVWVADGSNTVNNGPISDTITLDTVAPTAPVFTTPAAQLSVFTPTYNFEWWSYDETSEVATYTYNFYNTSDCTGIIMATATTPSANYSAALAKGSNSIAVLATNGAGLSSSATCSPKVTYSGYAHTKEASLVAIASVAPIQFGGLMYFSGTDATGPGLFRTDGTAGGTVLVKRFDANLGNPISNLTAGTTKFYFVGFTDAAGYELYVSDGTSVGTTMVADLSPGRSNGLGAVDKLAVVGDIAIFSPSNASDVYGQEIWRSDGTSGGTYMLKDINAGINSINISSIATVGSRVFFNADDGVNGDELWATDGTPGGTLMVKDIDAGGAYSSPSNFVVAGSTLYFSATTTATGAELWKSDGTAVGTVMVKDINPGTGPSSPANGVIDNGILYFSANDGTNGIELWRSDGTSGGTYLLGNIASGSASSSPNYITVMNGSVYMQAQATVAINRELYKVNILTQVVSLVKDINTPGSTGSYPSDIVVYNNNLYFSAGTSTNGTELWKSDGMTAGTSMVTDLIAGVQSGVSGNVRIYNSKIFMFASNGTYSGIYLSDGTAAGTTNLSASSIGIGLQGNITSQSGVQFGNYYYFAATDGVNGIELWRTDGTPAGTALFKDIEAGTGSSSPSKFTISGGRMYFVATTAASGQELWVSDGTAVGTVLVKEIGTTSTGSSPNSLTDVGGVLFFSATTSANGNELWKSTDGTSANTTMVKDICTSPGASTSSSPSNFAVVNGKLVFSATNGASVSGVEPWVSDGTSAGTTNLMNIAPTTASSSPSNFTVVGTTAFFTATNAAAGLELYKTDGTSGGTSLVKDIFAGATGSGISSLAGMGGNLYFNAQSSTGNNELWKSDGTSAGTVLLKEINYSSSSSPTSLVTMGANVYFTANDGLNGYELWKTDGTANGTVLVSDLTPGSDSSTIANMTVQDNALFMSFGYTSSKTMLMKYEPGTSALPFFVPTYPNSIPAGSATYFGKFKNGIIFNGSVNGSSKLFSAY